MTSDPLAARVRDAVDAFTVPAMPAPAIAARIASAPATKDRRRPRLVVAVVGGVGLLAGALAVAVPTADKWMTPAYYATVKRLTGVDFSHAVTVEVQPISLAQARRQTRFTIVVPRGKRVLEAVPFPYGDGVVLVLAVDYHAQATLTERWVHAKRPVKRSKMSALEGVGIHSDGSIRRFNTRRWRIGEIEYSMPMFTLEYHRYAEEVERATREAAGGR
ncbi:MAG TPA: hypothetical protein VIW69_09835 [Candidatus Elarobacter sp.]